jgi:hypothetical protein
MKKAVLISTYELGRQPFGLASPAAWLKAAAWDVVCVDVSRQGLDDTVIGSADVVAFHLPMHTATRLAAPLIARVRRINPAARICAYGLYAPLNAQWLRSIGVDKVIGAEFEEALTRWAQSLAGDLLSAPDGPTVRDDGDNGDERSLPRLRFLVPDRSGLPPPTCYATLQLPDGGRRLVGYTEATRGCKHRCRHCPVVPIYDGQFRVVQQDVVLADIDAQIAAGVRHITFGDPDFFNGPTHAMRLVEALHQSHPDVSYDVTIKIEHLLRHRDRLRALVRTGCLFVTSAVESVDDRVLALLAKGHTREDFVTAVAFCRAAGLTLVPTFVAFHPWVTVQGYCDLLDTIARLDLVDHVAPVQLVIRLLIPHGSRLLALDQVRSQLGAFDSSTLTYRWSHSDPRVDALHHEVSALVGGRLDADRRELFSEIASLAHQRAGLARSDALCAATALPVLSATPARPPRGRTEVPYLNEPWYC